MYKTIFLLAVLYECNSWAYTLRKEHRLRGFENILRRIFGSKREDMIECWRNLHNEELHNCTQKILLE
jgi:hypothetical protein